MRSNPDGMPQKRPWLNGTGLRFFVMRAARCLDLSEVPPTLVARVNLEATVLLKTIFDRISLPDLESIPDADQMKEQQLTRWRVPNTDITIAMVREGPRSGEFLFSPSTVDRLDEDYPKIKHLPHKPGGWVGFYTLYTEVSGRFIPDKVVHHLPQWAKTRVFNHPLWKWVVADVMVLIVLVRAFPCSSLHSRSIKGKSLSSCPPSSPFSS